MTTNMQINGPQKRNIFIFFTIAIIICCCFYISLAKGEKDEPCRDFCTVPSTGVAESLLAQLTDALHAAKCALANLNQWPIDPSTLANSLEDLQELTYDYIVIGAGTAGAIVAARLSELSPNVSVLLVEAGDSPPLESEIFTLSSSLQHDKHYAWSDYGEPSEHYCRAMKTSRCYYPRGKMLGGTGGLNDALFLRGSVANFDDWELAGNLGWSWQHLEPFYENLKVPLNYFQPSSAQKDLISLILNATTEMGIPEESSFETEGVKIGYTQQIKGTIKDGRRVSTARAYLMNDNRTDQNLHVIRQSLVTKIRINPKNLQAEGIEYKLRGQTTLRAKARHEIVVSAGAINSPKLLMQSGIGPKVHLNSVGITSLVDLPVGENLHDHGMMPLLLKFDKMSSSHWSALNKSNREDGENSMHQEVFDYFLNKRGPLSNRLTLMGFINTSSDIWTEGEPDFQLVSHSVLPRFSKGAFDFLGFSDELKEALSEKLQKHTLLQIVGSLLVPKSRGYIRLRPNQRPEESPLIYSNYGTKADDRKVLLRFIRFVQTLTGTHAFRAQGLTMLRLPIEECDRTTIYDTDDYWLCFIRYFYISSWHFVGTCRMGPWKDPQSVVDDRLRVHHVKALRIIDASIMPQITSCNTYGPTALIAEKGAFMMQEDYKRE